MTQAETKSGGIFGWYFNIPILNRIVFGLVAGAVVGIILANMPAATAAAYHANTRFFGDLFIRLLQMIVVPVIFFSVVAGVSAIQPSKLGRIGGKLMGLYLLTTFIAVSLAMIAASIFQPGAGLNIMGDAAGHVPKNVPQPLATVLLNLVPANPFGALNSGALLPILFFAISFGIGLALIRESAEEHVRKAGDTVYYVCSGAAEATYKIVWGVMQYAPIGVFFLISALFGLHGPKVVGSMMYVIVLTFCALAIHWVVTYSTILRLGGLNPLVVVKAAREALLTAFVTRSSNATLPVTIRCMKNLGVKPEFVSFSAPLGATINMDGTAIYLGVTVMFLANAVGQPLGIDQMFMVALLATLGAIGSAGVPGAGVIMLLMVLEGIGMKVEAGTAIAAAYALMFAIDAILDMGRTITNIAGDFAINSVVAKSEDSLDMEIYEKNVRGETVTVG